MTRTLILLLICISTSAKGQIQITQSDMPSINDTIRYSEANGGSFDFTNTGANYNWDYSGLGLNRQDIYEFKSLVNTPYATLLISGMPFGAIGYKIADSIGAGQMAVKNLYNFYEKTNSVWRAVGTGFTLAMLPIPAGGIHSDKDEIYTFPLNYNDKDSTTFSVTTPIGNQFIQLGTFKQKGYRLNHVEGWGMISTPYATNISCIKIKSVIVETDSLKITTPATNIGFNSVRVEYKWLSKTEKIPVLEVSGTEIGGVFTPTQIRYRDNYRVPGSPVNFITVKFDADKYLGIQGKDTFNFQNNSTPSFGASYNWQFTPAEGLRYVNGTDSSSSEPSLVFDSIGKFSVKLTVSNLIGDKDSVATDMIEILKDNSNSIQQVASNKHIVYPNPSKNILNIGPGFSNSSYFIYDQSGRLVLSGIIDDNSQIDISGLSKGTYHILAYNDKKYIFTQITKD